MIVIADSSVDDAAKKVFRDNFVNQCLKGSHFLAKSKRAL